MTALIGVYGTGGCGRGILPMLRPDALRKNAKLVFIDDADTRALVNGHPVLTWQQFLAEKATDKSVCLAVSNPHIRHALWQKCADTKLEICSAAAENVVIMDQTEIGPGSCLSPFVALTSNIRIGKSFHANLYSYVEHDCVVGDFVTFAPGVKCNGNVIVEDFAYIGAGAVIKQGKPGSPLIIGNGAVVGMGAVVTESVAPGQVVVGNPARVLR